MEEYTIGVEDLSKERREDFENLTEEYSSILQLMNLFIEVNNLDYDDAWDKANQRYDSDMTYAPNED